MPHILVLGASGTVGTLLVETLLAQGQRVKAATRQGRAFAGTQAVRFDFADPSTHAAAFDDVDRLYLLMPADSLQVADYLLPVVALAARRGVKVVMQSVMGAEHDPQSPYRQVELALPAGDARSSFIDARDIAASAAAALTHARFDGQAFTLTGPQAHSYREAAALLSRAADREISYTPVDDEAFVAALQAEGVHTSHGRMLAGLFMAVRQGHTAALSDGVQQLTGRPPRTLAHYVADHAASFSAA